MEPIWESYEIPMIKKEHSMSYNPNKTVISLELPNELYNRVKAAAAKAGNSVNAYIRTAISEYLPSDNHTGRPKKKYPERHIGDIYTVTLGGILQEVIRVRNIKTGEIETIQLAYYNKHPDQYETK